MAILVKMEGYAPIQETIFNAVVKTDFQEGSVNEVRRSTRFIIVFYFIDVLCFLCFIISLTWFFFKTGGVLRLVFQPPVEKWSITLWWMSLDSTAHNSLFRCFKELYCFANEHLLFCSFVLWLYCRITQIKRGNMCASIGLPTSRSLL